MKISTFGCLSTLMAFATGICQAAAVSGLFFLNVTVTEGLPHSQIFAEWHLFQAAESLRIIYDHNGSLTALILAQKAVEQSLTPEQWLLFKEAVLAFESSCSHDSQTEKLSEYLRRLLCDSPMPEAKLTDHQLSALSTSFIQEIKNLTGSTGRLSYGTEGHGHFRLYAEYAWLLDVPEKGRPQRLRFDVSCAYDLGKARK